MPCLHDGGGVEESTGRTCDHLSKRFDGTDGSPAKPNDNQGQKDHFTMSNHYESCTNGTGSENCEPGRLNHRNRSHGCGDTIVRSIGRKRSLLGERPHFSRFGWREKAYSAEYVSTEGKTYFGPGAVQITL